MITIKDIAKELNLSVNTVSRALNGKPDINSNTRERILHTAERLGYVPNSLARSLVAGHSFTIGLIVADVANPFYGSIIRGIEETARGHGYATLLANTNEQDEDERKAVEVLCSKRVDGLLIVPSQGSYDHIAQLRERGIPFVLVNRHIDEVTADCVIANNRLGAYLAVRHLVSLGHKRIAHITGPIRISSVRERIAGYRQALEEAHLPFDERMIVHTRLDMASGYEAARQHVSELQPTAIFTYSDLLATGVLKALREMGRQVPRDISLVGYDDIEFADFLEVPLTTVRQPRYEIGKRAMQVLLAKMNGPAESTPPVQVVLEPELVIRRSSGAPPVTP